MCSPYESVSAFGVDAPEQGKLDLWPGYLDSFVHVAGYSVGVAGTKPKAYSDLQTRLQYSVRIVLAHATCPCFGGFFSDERNGTGLCKGALLDDPTAPNFSLSIQ
ncbi:hypothetical protein SOM46_26280 [Pseudomonas fluorescens]|uniref:hypothetical protein n=1 Tax=Pseudomonas fluorescens TaxID=294 RepID=UPI001783E73C|nr:hypothetical protein [Pseudomonas fluorescens]MBD8239506.1 hypothetical protein [Pseudomonas fluorescens]MDY0898448.1 hypothetical protein [Pseudomonas fluorescens]